MSVTRQCCEATIWKGRPCGHPAKVQINDQWLCGIHDPARKLVMMAVADKRWKAKRRLA